MSYIGAETPEVAYGKLDSSNNLSDLISLPKSRANLLVDNLPGFRNKIINGDFDIWQRGTSQTSSGYGSDDRWMNLNIGTTKTASRQSFTLGHTEVPNNPSYFSRTVVASVAGSGNYAVKSQAIEGVHFLANKTVTVTFYAKADTNRNIALEFYQSFGSGGSPSTSVSIPLGLVSLTSSWKRYSILVTLPSISGKILGSDSNHTLILNFWFDAGSTLASRASNLGQQSGTFDLSHVSVVEGDAQYETDPFSKRHLGDEIRLCYRYYTKSLNAVTWQGDTISGATYTTMLYFPVTMRTAPTLGLTIISVNSFPSSTPTTDDLNADRCRVYLTANATNQSGFYQFQFTADAEL
ncbi:putative phage tail fiber protein [Rhizobium phage RHph_TM40]|uniref:Putative phage tail fiber protein n=1 Tax=Rhizobium phage RHph_TM30 TaxID=2509764 RepID=A0A7S5UXQ2_9CAUD|nr:tail fiber protein [Rhizobium phage RHph_TM30]QIG71438.1 putative phage tail fiber protein [Rhizobium phage RHph_TM30]QIG71802.1 putative phage tail fiber protein [Rhizobium phage RHph_TM40]QIG72162.1 putative phage tail fiber protein [Rhizobium phage RHph_TM2_3B]